MTSNGKSFKEFNDEWQSINLATIFQYFATNSFSRDQLSESGILKNLHYGDIHRKYNSIVNENDEITSYIKDINYDNKYELLKNNDLIFADASEDYEGIGKAVEVLNVNNKTISGLHTILARDNLNVFAPMFKGYYFNSPIVHNQLRVLANGFKVYGISKDSINKLNIKVPSTNEQTKIANTLYLLDKKIELQSKKIEDLKLFKKGLILSLKKNSFDWHTVCIKDLFKITRGVVIPKNELSEFKSGEYKYPVYSSQTSNQGVLGYSDTFDFNGKYLTWTTDGANAGKVFYRNGKFRCTNVCGVLYEDNIKFTNELFAELLNYETPKHVSYVGNPKLMNNIMANIKIKIPSNEIQENISLVINTINHKVNLETNKLLKLQELKKGLMQSMFV